MLYRPEVGYPVSCLQEESTPVLHRASPAKVQSSGGAVQELLQQEPPAHFEEDEDDVQLKLGGRPSVSPDVRVS